MSKLSPDEALRILYLNSGFSKPHAWIDYAISHDFKLVGSKRISSCVDCSSKDLKEVGSYIYYSSLIKLMRCGSCGLVGVDTLIDPDVLQSHFESAYKSEDYFITERKPVFDQISNLVLENCKGDISILDIGGAKGHLLAAIKESCPNSRLVLNDISTEACIYASEHYGFQAIAGSALKISSQFDVVMMIDVLYYESELSELWAHIPQLIQPGGLLFIRLPNRHFLLKFNAWIGKVRSKMQGHPGATSIMSFNPEHLYVFSQAYLRKRLESLGFSEIRFLPAKQIERGGVLSIISTITWVIVNMLYILTGGRVITSPSLVLMAKRLEVSDAMED